MGKLIFNILFYIYVAISCPIIYLACLIVFVVCYPFDKRRVVLHKLSLFWGLHYFWLSPLWRIKYMGGENVVKGRQYIIASNHQSMLDIALMYEVPKIFRWISKKEAFRIPFIGWLLKLHGDILISRGDTASTRKMLAECKMWLDTGTSIAIFPEGTRTPDGQVHKFKEGAFLMAKLNKTPILPVVINGTYEAMPKKGMSLKIRQTFIVKVLPEISAEEIAATGIKELSAKVQQVITEEHKRIAPQLYS